MFASASLLFHGVSGGVLKPSKITGSVFSSTRRAMAFEESSRASISQVFHLPLDIFSRIYLIQFQICQAKHSVRFFLHAERNSN